MRDKRVLGIQVQPILPIYDPQGFQDPSCTPFAQRCVHTRATTQIAGDAGGCNWDSADLRRPFARPPYSQRQCEQEDGSLLYLF